MTLELQALKSNVLTSAIGIKSAVTQLNMGLASALQEKIKCEVLVKSANDNTSINKCNALVEYLSVLANATNFGNISSENLHKSVKDAIDKIGNGEELNYLDTIKALDNVFDTKLCLIYANKHIASIHESLSFGVIHTLDNPTIEWNFNGNILEGSANMDYAFDTHGYKEVSVKVSQGDTQLSNMIRIKVEE